MCTTPYDLPKKIYLELTTRCNLQCPMCVRHAQGSRIVQGDMPFKLVQNLIPSLAGAECIVLNGIGESLLHPHLEAIVALLRKNMPVKGRIGLQSNGRLLDLERCERLLAAGLDTICLSLDEINQCSALHSSNGHTFSPVATAINHLAQAARTGNRPFRTGIETVVSTDNIDQLPALVTWAANQGIGYIIVSHLFPYGGDSFRDRVLFHANPQEAVELFDRWQQQAIAEGLHLADVPATYRKFLKSSADIRLQEMNAAMRKEARERDITLHAQTLMRHDRETMKTTEQFFYQARMAAESHGVELLLPPLYGHGNSARSCPFISDCAVFIAWTGEVMPCHFLWHTYCSRINGEALAVEEHVFGNIATQTLHAIWQGEQYTRFRAEAGKYEYAACWTCDSGPCSNLVNNNLLAINDCYGSRVPCGHCMWPIGWTACL